MFTKTSDKIADFLIKNNVVDTSEKEIYVYGVNRVLTTVLNVFTTILFGMIFGELLQGIIFFIAFIILRSFTGGYHAKTPIGCYILTVVCIAAALSVMKYVIIHYFICLGLSILSGFVIIMLSPMGTANKPLDEIEKLIYKKKSISIWSFEVLLMIPAIVLNNMFICEPIMMSDILIAASLIICYVKKND